jgi:hypothetical protein
MDFYSVNVPAPPPEVFDNQNIIQLAQIETWSNEIMDIHWRPISRQIIISIGDEWMVQPDTASIVTSLAHLFACEDYQIRIVGLEINDDFSTPEDIWVMYNSNWLYYAENNMLLHFRADVDYDAEQAPQWVDIVPDSQPLAPLPQILLE